MTPLLHTTRSFVGFSMYSTTGASFEQFKQNTLKHLGGKKKEKTKAVCSNRQMPIKKPGKNCFLWGTSSLTFCPSHLSLVFHWKEFLFLFHFRQGRWLSIF